MGRSLPHIPATRASPHCTRGDTIPAMLRPALVIGLLVAVAALTGRTAAQSTLADGSVVVVTGEGLFLVAGQVTTKVFDKTAFGGSLSLPSVTWIDGTDAFIVTTVKDAAGNPGGIWRVTLAPGGMGAVQD